MAKLSKEEKLRKDIARNMRSNASGMAKYLEFKVNPGSTIGAWIEGATYHGIKDTEKMYNNRPRRKNGR